MESNERLMSVASMVDSCHSIADVGTDHGYIPIYLVKSGICEKAIATDINKGPLEKARNNVRFEGLEQAIECRRGSGFSPLVAGEVQGTVIAGMGGNLIKDIIEDGLEIFKSLKFSILQPVQNAEVLRKYVYEKGFKIIDEELAFSDDKFYEIIKVQYGEKPVILDEFDYEISPVLIKKNNELVKAFIEYKYNKYVKIHNTIKDDSTTASLRKSEIGSRIKRLEELI